MQIKSFKAPTLKEAMANVKSELGVDAVILHTNKIKKGGILGFHAKEIVEVIAAIEDEPVVKEQKPAMDTGAASEAVLQAAAAARASRNSAPEPQPTGNFTPRNISFGWAGPTFWPGCVFLFLVPCCLSRNVFIVARRPSCCDHTGAKCR